MRVLLATILCAGAAVAADTGDLPQTKIDEIVKSFTTKEAEFAVARGNYTYHQTVRLQELNSSGVETGRWEQISDIVFDRDLKRTERVTRAPIPTLKAILLTPEDLADIRDIQPFVLTSENVGKYHVRYLGQEKLDDLNCYTFAVKPKNMVKGERYFSGIVWVDDLDVQVVKTYGRAVGITSRNQAFPKFETYRQKVDGKYWFPTYTIAEDTLHFETSSQRIRQVIKYEDYKQFKSDSRIISATEEVPTPAPKAVAPPPATIPGLPPPPTRTK